MEGTLGGQLGIYIPVNHLPGRVGPGLDLHRSVATKRAVAEDNVADVAMAAIAVRDRTNAGSMPICEMDILHQHTIGVVFNWNHKQSVKNMPGIPALD